MSFGAARGTAPNVCSTSCAVTAAVETPTHARGRRRQPRSRSSRFRPDRTHFHPPSGRRSRRRTSWTMSSGPPGRARRRSQRSVPEAERAARRSGCPDGRDVELRPTGERSEVVARRPRRVLSPPPDCRSRRRRTASRCEAGEVVGAVRRDDVDPVDRIAGDSVRRTIRLRRLPAPGRLCHCRRR